MKNQFYTIFVKHPIYGGELLIETTDRGEYLKALQYAKNKGRAIIWSYGGVRFEMQVEVEVAPGYYEGAVLDYVGEVELYTEKGGYDENITGYTLGADYGTPSAGEIASEDPCYNKGLSKILSKGMAQSIRKHWETISQEIEEIFAQVSTKTLAEYAHFSNGEVWYKEVGR